MPNNRMSGVNTLITTLSRYQLPNTFNPYKDQCVDFDRSDSARRRRANLRSYLNALREQPVDSLWIGRDLGYRGGRRTGLAFTDEAHLAELMRRLPQSHYTQATRGPLVRERTATIIWQARLRIDANIGFWNIFPFHPHNADNPLSNRAHTAAEREIGLDILSRLCQLLQPNRLIAVGATAKSALERADLAPCLAVRHPSYGGQRDFLNGIERIYLGEMADGR